MAEDDQQPLFSRCSDVDFWTHRERVLKLLELYESNECLWNATSPLYRNTVIKKAAKEEIGRVFSMTADEIWTKMSHIRDERQRLLRRVKQSSKSGAGYEDVYRPTLWWYELAKFLDRDTDNTPTVDNTNINTADTGTAMQSQTGAPVNNDKSYDGPAEKNRFKRRKQTMDIQGLYDKCSTAIDKFSQEISDDDGNQSATGKVNKERTTDETFGEYVGLELKKLLESDKQIVKYEIQGILLKASTGQLKQPNFNQNTASSVGLFQPSMPQQNPLATGFSLPNMSQSSAANMFGMQQQRFQYGPFMTHSVNFLPQVHNAVRSTSQASSTDIPVMSNFRLERNLANSQTPFQLPMNRPDFTSQPWNSIQLTSHTDHQQTVTNETSDNTSSNTRLWSEHSQHPTDILENAMRVIQD